MRIIVHCQPDEDPPLDAAPPSVLLRVGRLSTNDLQQLRRVLHTLVTTARRTVTVELAEGMADHPANVPAILVGAARTARATGSTIRVHSSSLGQRRLLAAAAIDEVAVVDDAEFTVAVGTPVRSAVAPALVG